MGFLNFFTGDANEKYLKKISPLIVRINELEKNFLEISDGDFKERTEDFKNRLKKGETLDAFLPEAFALAREASRRMLGQRHYDTQVVGGVALHQGKIAEMKTGEGKTLSATLPAYLNALDGKGVHIVTVNDYLSRRDAVWMGQIYHFLGLSVACVVHEQSFLYDPEFKKADEEKDETRDELGGFKIVQDYLRPCSRKEAYRADITYGTNNEFGFDFLRDNMEYSLERQAQRGFHYAIVDEVDSILIDEARTPLIISAPDAESSGMYKSFSQIVPKLEAESDYEVHEKEKAVVLTEEGIGRVEKILGIENIYEEKGAKYLHHLEQALRAQAVNPKTGKPLFEKDRHYVIKDGEAIIVDEFTGRLMPGRRWSGGLHQAIEAKEGVFVRPESKTLASVTFQNLFRMYNKLSGMTGTAATSAEEFDKVYKLDVVVIPTNKPMVRADLSDRVYKTEMGKFKAVVEEVKIRHQKGQPILIGTTSIEKNEIIGRMLDREGITHRILNAKNHEKEGEIIAQAGKFEGVTVATNMAGRGVDIILGGNPPDEENAKKVAEAGGLHVIGTERHEARRIDNQLRGRSGRQGDVGSSQFFVSLEDDLLRIFGGERIKNLMGFLKMPEDQPIEAKMVSGVIETAQGKIEGMHFDARKHLLDYDDVANRHRETIYKRRKDVLVRFENRTLRDFIFSLIEKRNRKKEDYFKKEEEIGAEKMREIERAVCLKIIDSLWVDHLEDMNAIRDSVRLRAYGQQDPLVEYKNEAHKAFQNLLQEFEANVVDMLFRARPTSLSAVPSESARASVLAIPKGKSGTGRNDPCPCGSGKKYKRCHGA